MGEHERTILIVEDSLDDETLITRALSVIAPHCSTVVAHNAEQAIAYIREHDEDDLPTLMLVDIGLPRIGGLELVEQVRKEPAAKGVPIYVLTGSGHRLDIQMSQRVGANGFIQKPVVPGDMETALEPLRPILE
jgi:two-component system response regulator